MHDLRISLYYHLHNNHFPPVDPIFIDSAIEAIRLHNDGCLDDMVELPNGVTKSAQEIVEELHLGFYLDTDDVNDNDVCDHEWEPWFENTSQCIHCDARRDDL